jgi:hypothetical protein
MARATALPAKQPPEADVEIIQSSEAVDPELVELSEAS